MDESLSYESFLEGAKKAAHRAMDAHARREFDQFALQAGVAIEKLSKAILVAKNPVYLVEMRANGDEMLLYLGGHLQDVKRVRTVGASEAIARLRRIGVLTPDPELDLLLMVRNGVAHAKGDDEAERLLPVLARTVETLLEHQVITPEDFWERWTSTVRVAVSHMANQLVRDVQVRIRQHRHTFEDVLTRLPPEVAERITTSPIPRPATAEYDPWNFTKDDVFRMLAPETCPACKCVATKKLVPITWSASGVSMRIEGLSCKMCNLELTSFEEVQAAGMGVQGEPGAPIMTFVGLTFPITLPTPIDFSETQIS